MKTIYNFSLLDILPETFTSDPTIHAICLAIDKEINKLSNATKETLHLPRIDKLPESVLDLLAWQWHVDFYEPIGMDINTKRELIKKAISAHRIKGTPAAVENLFSNIFKGGKIEEWFEYGGNPYHFKITALGKQIASEDQLTEFKHALESVKNVRSWLDGFEVSITELMEWYLGLILSDLLSVQYKPTIDNQLVKGNINLGFSNISSKFIKQSLQIASDWPNLQINHGFHRQDYQSIIFPRNSADQIIHDLSATALLDLLLVGLGIVREGSENPINEWIFRNYKAEFAIFLQKSQLNQNNYTFSQKYKVPFTYKTDFISSVISREIYSNSLKYNEKIDLGVILQAYQGIINEIRDFSNDYTPLDEIKYKKRMMSVVDFAMNEFDEIHHSITPPHSTFSELLYFHAIFSKNILQKIKTDDIIPTDERVAFNKLTRIIHGFVPFVHLNQALNPSILSTKYLLNFSTVLVPKTFKSVEISNKNQNSYHLANFIGYIIRNLLSMNFFPEESNLTLFFPLVYNNYLGEALFEYDENQIKNTAVDVVNNQTPITYSAGLFSSAYVNFIDESPINLNSVEIWRNLEINQANTLLSHSLINLVDNSDSLNSICHSTTFATVPIVSILRTYRTDEVSESTKNLSYGFILKDFEGFANLTLYENKINNKNITHQQMNFKYLSALKEATTIMLANDDRTQVYDNHLMAGFIYSVSSNNHYHQPLNNNPIHFYKDLKINYSTVINEVQQVKNSIEHKFSVKSSIYSCGCSYEFKIVNFRQHAPLNYEESQLQSKGEYITSRIYFHSRS